MSNDVQPKSDAIFTLDIFDNIDITVRCNNYSSNLFYVLKHDKWVQISLSVKLFANKDIMHQKIPAPEYKFINKLCMEINCVQHLQALGCFCFIN